MGNASLMAPTGLGNEAVGSPAEAANAVRGEVHVNGPWCITFKWIEGEVWRVDLEQYH